MVEVCWIRKVIISASCLGPSNRHDFGAKNLLRYFYARSGGTSPDLAGWNPLDLHLWRQPWLISRSVIEQRRTQLHQELLELWQPRQGRDMYVVMCPCDLSPCGHMPEAQFPRLKVGRCYYPGELDYFIVEQPFLQQHCFKVTWLCFTKHGHEFSCGAPEDFGGLQPLDAALGNQA